MHRACVDGPWDSRRILQKSGFGSNAVMCSAYLRGAMTAGPDGFRERHPNSAAEFDCRCTGRILSFVGSTGYHLSLSP
jgi:hypothetical protein